MTDPTVPDSRAGAWSWRVLPGIPTSHHSHCPGGRSSCAPLLHASPRGEDLPPFTPLVSSLGGNCFSQNKYILGLPENRGRGASPETVAPACPAPPSHLGSRAWPPAEDAACGACHGRGPVRRLDAHTSQEQTRADLWGVPEAPPDCSLP